MKRLATYFKQPAYTEKSAPIVFLTAIVLSFGLLIPSLGYYMDDWAYVFYANLKGVNSLREMLMYDTRPYAAWLYILGFKVLGFRPLAWHIMSLIMHWGIVLTLWALVRSIWPMRKFEAIQAALLFTVYPFWMLQPFPIAYTHVWFGFLTFNLSLALMVWAVRDGTRKTIPITILAMCLEAAHLFTGEYFAGMELVRIVVLWILISRQEASFTKRAQKAFLHWLPYLVVVGIFAYWRVFVYQNPPEVVRNSPVILHQLITSPLKAIGFLVDRSIRDAFSVLTIGWQKATDADLLTFSTPAALFRLGVAFIAFAFSFLYLSKFQPTETKTADDWKVGSLVLSVASLLTGGLPIWLIGRAIVESRNLLSASRFGVPATLGAALITFLFLDWLISERTKKIVVLSILIAIATNFHLQDTGQFQYSWEKQQLLSNQLLWRAPSIKPGTAIFTDEEVLGVMGEYAVSFSINTTYQVKDIKTTPPYWYFPFNYTNPNVGQLLQGAPLEYKKLSMNFSGNSKQMLLLSFDPGLGRCLWVLQPQDTNLRLVNDNLRELSAASDINLIQQVNGAEPTLPESIYGKQNRQTWCYYFEKADLARQYQQWDEVVRLWNEASSAGLRAGNGFEYIPFIEGFGNLEDWERVRFLTKSANKITAALEPSLCTAFDRIAATAPASQQRDETIQNLKSGLKCVNYQ